MTLCNAARGTTLCKTTLGEQVLSDERRKEIDPGHKRQLSLFQLGWRQLRRAVSCTALPAITLVLRPFKPEPAYNRRKSRLPAPTTPITGVY